MDTHLRVLGKSYPTKNNMTEFIWFSRNFASLCFGAKAASACYVCMKLLNPIMMLAGAESSLTIWAKIVRRKLKPGKYLTEKF